MAVIKTYACDKDVLVPVQQHSYRCTQNTYMGHPVIFHTECGEAGEPAAHERVQDERAGLRRPAEDRGEGAERRPPARSPLSLQGQNRGQRHAGHPGERGCKEPNRLLLTSVSGLVT